MSLFRSSAWSALSPQRSLPLAPAGALAPVSPRHTLQRARAPGLAAARALTAGATVISEGAVPAIPAVLAREPADGR